MVKITFFWAGIFLNNISLSGRLRRAIVTEAPPPLMELQGTSVHEWSESRICRLIDRLV